MNVLDLFAGLGGWSAAARDRGHHVVTVDMNPKFRPDFLVDVATLDPAPGIDLILASPPCEAFSVARIGQNWNRDHTPKTEKARAAIVLVDATLRLIEGCAPRYWVMENPVGKLRRIMEVFHSRVERRTTSLCQYGTTWRKGTDLWGVFPPGFVLKPPCKNGDPCHEAAPRGAKTGVQGVRDPAKRALLPYRLGLDVVLAAEEAMR